MTLCREKISINFLCHTIKAWLLKFSLLTSKRRIFSSLKKFIVFKVKVNGFPNNLKAFPSSISCHNDSAFFHQIRQGKVFKISFCLAFCQTPKERWQKHREDFSRYRFYFPFHLLPLSPSRSLQKAFVGEDVNWCYPDKSFSVPLLLHFHCQSLWLMIIF